jgi:VCBS repeat-containing protein
MVIAQSNPNHGSGLGLWEINDDGQWQYRELTIAQAEQWKDWLSITVDDVLQIQEQQGTLG